MTLIKSISGIRGTIGGQPGDTLSPIDVVKFSAAFGHFVLKTSGINKIVLGRDARLSGDMMKNLVVGTLQAIGIDVIDLGLATTPTVEIAVPLEKAGGGIILTASHNPKQWNALKLLNAKGEFISDLEGKEVLRIADSNEINYVEVDHLGTYTFNDTYLQKHIDLILELPWVDVNAIKARNFKVVIDCVNSVGGVTLPPLLKALGVEVIHELFCTPDGKFPHNPEPLPENLTSLSSEVLSTKSDLGIAVDPDVDRLCFVSEDGNMFGEEYTLVAIADYLLNNTDDAYLQRNHYTLNTVSNLSSTRALRDVTERANGKYFASAVGEVNVVTMMKANNALIGGEGNGGIILPALHYGRDALVGIALFLSHLAKQNKTCSQLRASYPNYFISKNKISLTEGLDIDALLKKVEEKYKNQPINTVDGLKIEFDKEWVHLRRSNTEPIIRIYSEGQSETTAETLAHKIMDDIREIMNKQ